MKTYGSVAISAVIRRLALVLLLTTAACARAAVTPIAPPTPSPQPFAAATFPAPPQPTAGVELVLPAPLPTPGGPVEAYPSLNTITSLAFAPDGALWASTYEGLLRWDLAIDTYQHFDQADGLPSPGVLSLDFAPDGSLWAGTQSGVVHYGGTEWTTYPLAGGQAGVVYDVAVAGDSTVWAGTDQGVYTLAVQAPAGDAQAWRGGPSPGGTASGLVWQVAPAPDGSIWVSTHSGGVSRFEPAVGRWTNYTAPDSFPRPSARMLAIGPDGQPWVHIGYDHVYRFDGQQWEVAYPAGGGQWVCDMAFAAGGTPWIATCDGFHAYGGGLAYRDGDAWRTITTKDGLASDDLTALALRPDGVIAAGSRQGISVRQEGRWRTLRAGPTLVPVTGAAVAADGTAWFAFGDDHWQAAGGGLAGFDGRQWQYVTSRDGLPVSDNVRALAVAADGSLWAGGGCGLGRMRDGRWKALAACEEIEGNVHDLAFAPDGAAWFATEWDVYRLDGDGVMRHDKQLPLALAVATDGTAWVSHQPIGGGWISTFDGDAWRPLTDTLRMGVVISLAATPDGGVWAGSGRGAARLAGPGGQRLYTSADGLPDGGVIDLAVGPDGTLWAAGRTAIARFDGDAWTAYDLGVPDAQIRAIAPGAGIVWLATQRGVFSLRGHF